jgi:hypothetical protein
VVEGAEILATWTATSKSASGEASGTITIPVGDRSVTLRELVSSTGSDPKVKDS